MSYDPSTDFGFSLCGHIDIELLDNPDTLEVAREAYCLNFETPDNVYIHVIRGPRNILVRRDESLGELRCRINELLEYWDDSSTAQ